VHKTASKQPNITITEQRKSFGMRGQCLPRFEFCFMLL